MTPDQYCAKILQIAKALETEVRRAEEATAKECVQMYVQASGGPYSLRQLARMGHPYGKGLDRKVFRLVSRLDPTIINDQTGNFRRAWFMQRYYSRNSKIQVINNTKEARFMLGTKRMIARRIDQRVTDLIEPIRNRRLLAALQKALRS